MNTLTRAALDTTLARIVTAETEEQATALLNQARGMLAALLSEKIISPLGHAAELLKVTQAKNDRAQRKGK